MGRMMVGNRFIHFLVEGASESKILKAFNINRKIKVFNISQHSIDKILRTFMKGTTDFFIIFDIDSMKSKIEEQKRMSSNLDRLLSCKGNRIFLLQQTDNLEDEIVRCSSGINNKVDLFKIFNTVGKNKFKNAFCSCTDPIQTLNQHGFNKMILWNQALIQNLKNYAAYQVDFVKLSKLIKC